MYRGHDDGAGCPGDDAVTGVAGRAVTWCFVVTNTGDTRLAPVTLEDADLGVDQVTMTADGFEFVTADCTGDRTNVVTMPWVFTIVGVTEVEGIPAWQIIDQAGEKGVVAVTPDGIMRFGSPGSPAGADGFPIQLDPIEQAAQRVTTA